MGKVEFIIDRIENDYVVAEGKDGDLINIKKSNVVGMLKEGDVLIKKDNIYFIDKEATKLRCQKINEMMKGLWEE